MSRMGYDKFKPLQEENARLLKRIEELERERDSMRNASGDVWNKHVNKIMQLEAQLLRYRELAEYVRDHGRDYVCIAKARELLKADKSESP